LKRLHFLEDREGYHYDLRYIRDKEGREVDFAVLKEGKLEELVEVKYSNDSISKSILYYAERLKPERATQITATIRRPYDKNRLRVTDPFSYFRGFFAE
jgi:predicted AAA+ superfamily ATPase